MKYLLLSFLSLFLTSCGDLQIGNPIPKIGDKSIAYNPTPPTPPGVKGDVNDPLSSAAWHKKADDAQIEIDKNNATILDLKRENASKEAEKMLALKAEKIAAEQEFISWCEWWLIAIGIGMGLLAAACLVLREWPIISFLKDLPGDPLLKFARSFGLAAVGALVLAYVAGWALVVLKWTCIVGLVVLVPFAIYRLILWAKTHIATLHAVATGDAALKQLAISDPAAHAVIKGEAVLEQVKLGIQDGVNDVLGKARTIGGEIKQTTTAMFPKVVSTPSDALEKINTVPNPPSPQGSNLAPLDVPRPPIA